MKKTMFTFIEGSKNHRMYQMVGWGLFAALALILPFILPEFQVGRLNRAIFLAVAILGLNLVVGYSGLIALGHSAFIGIGAFVTTTLVQDHNWDYWMTIPVSMGACFIVGLGLGVPALRIKGLYLALVTVAFATVFPSFAKIDKWSISARTGGVNGRNIDEKTLPPGWAESIGFKDTEPSRYTYFLIVALALAAFWMTRNLLKSRPGRAIVAIRDNETGAAVSGVNITAMKVITFGVSASLGGLAGVCWAMDRAFVSEADFGFPLAIELLVGLVIGGVATLWGGLLGGLVVVFVREFTKNVSLPLGFYTLDGNGPLSGAIFGVILILVTFFAPGGLVSILRKIRDKFVTVIPQPPENFVSRRDTPRVTGDSDAALAGASS